ncbi:deoxyguanosine kinase [Agrilactobacillus composti DSM 18527 = JCM 14202]|uniref:Deoxyguanosine kinase n=1 Tax=Agrilactobacillus composti DSM 18527 = JCM 14202 TaxID=1423734 RepID=X0PTM2_9LACO|nr:deoxynucleoside kinase [Agrilactobacillus composti]KRM36520.1 deoxyguanosine kinase [Agrilactobacillus composti DSM 18527 = JCM 14202]GAF41377.1 deoxyadenosine kinase [Agrilactobacillus composti DSM 18527 = JCM 14202]
MTVLVLSGVIGSGKSSLTKILAEHLGTTAFYEQVDNNPVLPLFYKGNKIAEAKRAAGQKDAINPYTFLLQIYFLNTRFHAIKAALTDDNNVLDRSIYEDEIFMKMNTDQGHATKEEYLIYQDLLQNMMAELAGTPKKHPDLLINIHVSYDTMIQRIQKRGRPYEQLAQDPNLPQYYQDLIAYYQEWYASKIQIDGDQYDFITNPEDRQQVLATIDTKLQQLKRLPKKRRQVI